MTKENPKRAASAHKIRFHGIPAIVEAEIAAVMTSEGGRKYSAYNYRSTPVLASDYYDAIRRHLAETWELGEEIDKPSGVAHLTKLICSAIVWRDAWINGMLDDDRPPPVSREHWERIQKIVENLNKTYPDPKPAVRKWGKRLFVEDGEVKIEHLTKDDVLRHDERQRWRSFRECTHCQSCGAAEGYGHIGMCPELNRVAGKSCPSCGSNDGEEHWENCPKGRKFVAERAFRS